MKLTKDNLGDFCKRRSKVVEVGGYEIRIVEMTIPQQLKIEQILKSKVSDSELISPVLQFSIVDDNNDSILDETAINNLPANIAASLFKHCIEFNSISEKDLEVRAKNS